MSKVIGIDLAGCTVSDVSRSVEFYRDKLGLVPNMVHEQGAEFIFPGGETFGLYNPGDGSKPHFTVMFAVDDIKSAIAAFRERGLQLSDPQESPVCTMAFAQDPDGNPLIVHQRKEKDTTPAPAYDRTATSVNGMDIMTYFTRDAKRSIAFYRDVLGLTPSDIVEEMGAEFQLADGTTFGVWTPDDLSNVPGGGVMFSVDDLPAKIEQLRSRGVGVSEIEETPVCYMAFAPDPDGTMAILHKHKVPAGVA